MVEGHHTTDALAPPRVSIVIPCYNGEKYLALAIESCLQQSLAPHEVIVVDDGSQDGSAEVAAGFPGVTCISQANRGLPGARNSGMEAATGEYLIFLDHDDILLPNATRIGLEMLRSHPEASFTTGAPQLIGPEGEILSPQRNYVRPPEGPITYAEALHPRRLSPPVLVMFRGDLLRRVGGFAAGYFEDYDIYLRLLALAPAWRHGVVVGKYRRHPGNTSRRLADMAAAVQGILDRQRAVIGDDPALLAALEAGRHAWRRMYGEYLPRQVLRQLVRGQTQGAFKSARMFARTAPDSIQGFVTRAFADLAGRPWPPRQSD